MSKGRQYIVVENSGMNGECDVGHFGTYMAAAKYLEKTYTAAERDHTSPKCLFPDICVELMASGATRYEPSANAFRRAPAASLGSAKRQC